MVTRKYCIISSFCSSINIKLNTALCRYFGVYLKLRWLKDLHEWQSICQGEALGTMFVWCRVVAVYIITGHDCLFSWLIFHHRPSSFLSLCVLNFFLYISLPHWVKRCLMYSGGCLYHHWPWLHLRLHSPLIIVSNRFFLCGPCVCQSPA